LSLLEQRHSGASRHASSADEGQLRQLFNSAIELVMAFDPARSPILGRFLSTFPRTDD